jgi:hypothetical protein
VATSIKPKSLSEDAIRALEHIFIGPTWAKNEDGSWLLPERTLGWQIAMWCTTWLRGMDGKPWKFTPEQLRFVLWWYAVDENGRFTYRTGVLQRMKGWGKDPLLAVISLVEFVGPSRVAMNYGAIEWHEIPGIGLQPKGCPTRRRGCRSPLCRRHRPRTRWQCSRSS